MANLRANNLTGTGGRNAIKGSVMFTGKDGPPGWLELEIPDHAIGTSNFTAEWWFKPKVQTEPGTANRRMLIIGNNNVTGSISVNWDAVNKDIQINYDASSGLSASTIKVYGGSWYHIAVVRTGTGSNETKLYINGVLSDSFTLGNNITQTNVEIGIDTGLSDAFSFHGLISNLRVTKSVVYSAAFTPPTSELTALEDTIILCCQDTDNPTQEATGKQCLGIGTLYYGKRYSNIATNGDFETGTTTGWTNGGCGTFEVTTDNPHSGTYSLHCVSDGNGDNVYTTVSLDITKRYKISAYIKCVGPAGTSAKAKMKIGTSNGGSQNYESQTVGYDSYKGFDEWDYVEWIGLPAASTLYVSFNESSSNNVNEWYVDDLRVELWYPEETENLLANPNFLTGATGWSFSSTPSGEYTISNNRLNVADTSRTSDAFATQQLFATAMAEGKYRITADYSFSSGGFDAGIGGKRIWTIQGTSSNTWELEAGDGNVNFRLITGQTGAGYYNNVHLYRVAEPKRNNPVPPLGIDEGVTFEGDTKVNTQQYMYFPTGDTAQRSRGRMILFGGGEPGRTDNIDYLQMTTFGNSIDFGNLVCGNVWGSGATASPTRGVFWGGENQYTKLDYVTIATTGRSISFGTGTPSNGGAGFGNNTRGIWSLGGNNVLEYVTIATTGNATNFGDQTILGGSGTTAQTAFASSTRGVIAGGYGSNPYPQSNVIEYVTIATTGNGTNFGDLDTARSSVNGVSNSTRGVIAGGYTFPGTTTYYNIIEFVTIATTGDTTDFGDLTITKRACYNGSTPTRGVFAAGTPQTNAVNSIDYITITTTGNAADFGDTRITQRSGSGASDSHGGLS